ncbi:MAG: hypothetical protein LBR41_02410, partial [Rickettsiales bacterium]|nr:hypothetical protein [Rickettsiales bacterium]
AIVFCLGALTGYTLYSPVIVVPGVRPLVEEPLDKPVLPPPSAPRVCDVVESALSNEIWHGDGVEIHNALVYAELYKRGCPENGEAWKNRANAELEIAQAKISVENEQISESTANDIVVVYNGIDMGAEAQKFWDHMKFLIGNTAGLINDARDAVAESLNCSTVKLECDGFDVKNVTAKACKYEALLDIDGKTYVLPRSSDFFEKADASYLSDDIETGFVINHNDMENWALYGKYIIKVNGNQYPSCNEI